MGLYLYTRPVNKPAPDRRFIYPQGSLRVFLVLSLTHDQDSLLNFITAFRTFKPEIYCRSRFILDFLQRKILKRSVHLNKIDSAISRVWSPLFIFSKNNQYILTSEGVMNKTRHSRTSTQLVVVVNGLYWTSKCSFWVVVCSVVPF